MGIDVKYKCGSLQHGQFIKYKFFGWIIKYILFICKYIPLLPNFEEHIYTYDIFDEIPNYDDIIYISCSYNQLTELPKLPNSLQILNCSYNQLTSLPKLPNSLIHLDCCFNKLIVLPELPNSLKRLYCGANKLASLPKLPYSLEILSCYNNKFIKKISYKYLKVIVDF